MTYKQFKEKFKDKKERRSMFITWLKMRIKELWWNFKNSSFINHISFLWHWKNFFFLLKHPFYKSRNVWTGKFMGYDHTWYDMIPTGWQIAFGKQLTEDIHKAFKEDKKKNKHLTWKKALSWEQIKEKYGELRLYASATENIMKVLEHYESISADYCICCGKPSTRMTLGWISFVCDDCAKEVTNISIPIKDLDEYYKDSKAYIETHKNELNFKNTDDIKA